MKLHLSTIAILLILVWVIEFFGYDFGPTFSILQVLALVGIVVRLIRSEESV